MNINMDDNFYDDIPSFMPTADDDYCLNDDIDEILRSTDSHLDASLGLDNFSAFGANTFDGKLTENYEDKPSFNSTLDNLDNFDFGGFSSPTSSTPTTLSDHDTPPHTSSQRSTSTCSMDGEALNFNPEGFHNFFNNKQDYGIMIQDDIKIDDEFIPPYAHSMMAMNNAPIRNTPSPSGSCSSSGGSSTSGIQSDASSILEHATTMSSSSISELQPIKMETDVPVSVKIETDETPIKVQPLKINRIPAVKMPTAMDNARKTMPPPAQTPTLSQTTKPKTIFLSSGDFKALMQKVNSTTATNAVPTTKMGNNNNNNNNKKIINGQMPKIIMKTKNGQFVTSNKLGQSKIMKTTTAGQLLIKQANNFNINNKMMTIPASKTSSVSSMLSSPAAAAATTTTTAPPTATSMATKTNVSSYKGMVDEKMFKKQQRMIKNRESASLSRKKKKEYVVSLETRITDLEKENYTLKGENKSLRSQLAALAQTCQCNHGNVGDFILNTLNMSKKVATTTTTTTFAANLNNNKNHNNQHHLQQNHNKINHVQNQINNKNTHNNNHNVVSSSYNHVKIAPKPMLAGKCLKQRITGTATMKKNVAVLFAMAFMVTLNVGHFQNYFNNRMALDSDLEILDDSSMLSTNNNNNNGNMLVDGGAVGRRLLWVPSESEHQEQMQEQLLQRNKRATDLEVPPLHFLRPLQHHNKINNNNNNSRERNKLLDEVELMDNGTPLSTTTTTTSTSFNQTENLRLASNLQKWIDGNDFLNLTDKTLGGDILNMGFKLPSSSDYLLHDIQQQKQQPSQQKQQEQQKQVKRKFFMSAAGDNNSNNKQGKFDDYDDDLERSNNNNVKNSLDVFKPKINEEYLRLFRTIKRRDDTFYVLSFNMDHVLLPASMYNKSTRPKMSLMLPAGDPTNNGDIVLMQIDCEVVNTTEIELKKHMIPEKLRPGGQKYQGAATVPPRTPQPHVNHNDEYKKLKQKQPENINNTREEVEGPKQKPIVRTYYMMGPRTEQAAAELQKHNQNKDEIEPMFKRDELLVERNNATLFSRMRDTIRGDFHKNLLN